MRLTDFTDFGLRMLMVMAGAPDQPFTSTALARRLGLPRNHLSKILHRLAQGGIVTTRRGRGGGAMLVLPPDRIRLGEVVRLLEDGHVMVECFLPTGGNCTMRPDCGLRMRLKRAETSFLNDLNRSTLADIVFPGGLPEHHRLMARRRSPPRSLGAGHAP